MQQYKEMEHETEIQREKETANQHFINGKFVEAKEMFVGILGLLHRSHSDYDEKVYQSTQLAILNNLAATVLKLNEYDAAVKYCTTALDSCDPVNVKALYRRALGFKGLGSISLAEGDCLKILELEPANSQAVLLLEELSSLKKVSSSVATECSSDPSQKSVVVEPVLPATSTGDDTDIEASKVEPTEDCQSDEDGDEDSRPVGESTAGGSSDAYSFMVPNWNATNAVTTPTINPLGPIIANRLTPGSSASGSKVSLSGLIGSAKSKRIPVSKTGLKPSAASANPVVLQTLDELRDLEAAAIDMVSSKCLEKQSIAASKAKSASAATSAAKQKAEPGSIRAKKVVSSHVVVDSWQELLADEDHMCKKFQDALKSHKR